MVQVHGPTSNGPTSLKISFESLGPLTRCKLNVEQEEWHAPKSECVGFFKYMPKKDNFEKHSSLTILLSYFGFTCIHFLLNVSKRWLANLITTIFR
jgi:hypothetical protein